jgi:hypothetical protein
MPLVKFRPLATSFQRRLAELGFMGPPQRGPVVSEELRKSPESICLICVVRESGERASHEIGSTTISIPYVTSCGHMYCYTCLSEAIIKSSEEGEVWRCHRCGEGVTSITRYHIDLLDESSSTDDNV